MKAVTVTGRALWRGLVLLAVAMVLASCGWRGVANVPLPGGPGSGADRMTIYVQMPDTLALNVNSRVRVADVFVGSVRAIELKNWVATLTLDLDGGVQLPENALARIGQTSLLGTQHVELSAPPDPSPQRLHNGDTIALKNATSYPTTERTLASIATVLNGGGISNLEVIQTEVNNILDGNAVPIRDFLGKLDVFTQQLNAQRDELTRAIDSTNELLKIVADRNDTLDRVLTEFPPLIKHFADQRNLFADAVTALGRFSKATDDTLSAARGDVETNLQLLQRPLTQLGKSSPYLVDALKLMLTAPYPIENIQKVIRGDYINTSATFDLTLSSIDNSFLTGTGFSGALRALEQAWGRDPSTMIPDVRFTPNPNSVPGGPLVERSEGGDQPMLTRVIRIQLALFTVLTVIALTVLGWYYLRLPSMAGIGQYTLTADLPASGGLYATANVTYRGITIGKVTAVEPTEHGARATMSISDDYKIPVDAVANVHSVSAIGEQYIDLVSDGNPAQYFSSGQTVTKGTVPREIGPALDAANRGLAVLPKEKISGLLDETSQAVGGLGPALQRLVDGTQAIVGDFKTNIGDVNDIINHSAPIIDSQVNSGDAIQRWAANLNSITAQAAAQDQALRSGLAQAAPTADAVTAVFGDVREALPQTLANLEVVLDMLKRYNKGLEQTLVVLPQGAAIAQAVATPFKNSAALDFSLTINQPPPCLTGFLPASQWRSPADTSTAPLPTGLYCKIPQDTPANVVRGARNYPCVDVPGKRAATPQDCRSEQPYVPLGTNPWYGDPNQLVNCPAPGARCDQPVQPGLVIPAPTINTGNNPLPADRLPAPPAPTSDPLSSPGNGSVQCSGQQPNPCLYTPAPGNTAIYNPSSGEVVGPDGVRYSVNNSTSTGDDGWKEMLAPAS